MAPGRFQRWGMPGSDSLTKPHLTFMLVDTGSDSYPALKSKKRYRLAIGRFVSAGGNTQVGGRS